MTSTTKDYPTTNDGHLGQPVVGSAVKDTTMSQSRLGGESGLDSGIHSSGNQRPAGSNTYLSKEPGRVGEPVGQGVKFDDHKHPNTRSTRTHDDRGEYRAATGAGNRPDTSQHLGSHSAGEHALPGAGERTDTSRLPGTHDATGHHGHAKDGIVGDKSRADAFDSVPVRGATGYEPRKEGTGTTSREDEQSSKKGDSTMGKIMEKAGGVLKNQNLVEKGIEKREGAAGVN